MDLTGSSTNNGALVANDATFTSTTLTNPEIWSRNETYYYILYNADGQSTDTKGKINENKYIDFVTIIPSGIVFTPSKINLVAIGRSTGNNAYKVDFIDGTTTTTIQGVTQPGSGTESSVDYSFSSPKTYAEGTTLTIRVYFGINHSTSPRGVGLRNVSISGSYSATSDPTLKFSLSTLSFDLNPVKDSQSEIITLNGANLTDGTYQLTVPTVAGLTVEPSEFTVADGAVNQEFTVTYTSDTDVAEAVANISATVDELSTSVAVTYSSRKSFYELAAVSESKTWDWTSWNETIELKNDGSTALSSDKQYVFSDIVELCGLTAPSSFDVNTIAFKGQYPVRSKKSQAGYWILKTTVPGTVAVTFSDTGSSLKDGETVEDYAKRYLNVNGVNSDVYTRRTGSSSDQKTATVFVPAGDVVITGMKEDGETYQAIVVNKIVFTPVTSTTIKVDNSLGYRTFASKYPTDWSTVTDMTAYTATISEGVVTFNKVEGAVPAKTGLLLKAGDGEYTVPVAATEPATIENAFIGVTAETVVNEAGIFVLLDGDQGVGFYKTTAESFTVSANTAYLPALTDEARTFIWFDSDETTGIEAVSTTEQRQNGVYNLNGQRISMPAKGLYIVDGKKFVK